MSTMSRAELLVAGAAAASKKRPSRPDDSASVPTTKRANVSDVKPTTSPAIKEGKTAKPRAVVDDKAAKPRAEKAVKPSKPKEKQEEKTEKQKKQKKTRKPTTLKSLDDHPLFSAAVPDFSGMKEKERKRVNASSKDHFQMGDVLLPGVKGRVPVEQRCYDDDEDEDDVKEIGRRETEDGIEIIYDDPDEDDDEDSGLAPVMGGSYDEDEVENELDKKTADDMYKRMLKEQDERRSREDDRDPNGFLKNLMIKYATVAELEGQGFSRKSKSIRAPRRQSKKSRRQEEEEEEGEFDPNEWTVEEGEEDVIYEQSEESEESDESETDTESDDENARKTVSSSKPKNSANSH
jgi:hypothetical protein